MLPACFVIVEGYMMNEQYKIPTLGHTDTCFLLLGAQQLDKLHKCKQSSQHSLTRWRILNAP